MPAWLPARTTSNLTQTEPALPLAQPLTSWWQTQYLVYRLKPALHAYLPVPPVQALLSVFLVSRGSTTTPTTAARPAPQDTILRSPADPASNAFHPVRVVHQLWSVSLARLASGMGLTASHHALLASMGTIPVISAPHVIPLASPASDPPSYVQAVWLEGHISMGNASSPALRVISLQTGTAHSVSPPAISVLQPQFVNPVPLTICIRVLAKPTVLLFTTRTTKLCPAYHAYLLASVALLN